MSNDSTVANAEAAPSFPAVRFLVACPTCDALQRVDADAGGVAQRCVRCGTVVRHKSNRATDHALPLTVAAAICLLVGNVFPVVAIEANGNTTSSTLVGASLALHLQGMNAVAAVVFLTTIVIPVIEIACVTCLLVLARGRHLARPTGVLLRFRDRLRPWNMIEIFVLGAFVAIVKLGDLARIIFGAGMWSLLAFTFLYAMALGAFDRDLLWQEADS